MKSKSNHTLNWSRNVRLAPQVLFPTNIKKLMLNVPADIVINLNGIGVNPAVKTIQKLYLSYIAWILLNPSIVTPGTYSKNILAM